MLKYMNITNGGLIISAMWIASGLASINNSEGAAFFFLTAIVNAVWIGVVWNKNRNS